MLEEASLVHGEIGRFDKPWKVLEDALVTIISRRQVLWWRIALVGLGQQLSPADRLSRHCWQVCTLGPRVDVNWLVALLAACFWNRDLIHGQGDTFASTGFATAAPGSP